MSARNREFVTTNEPSVVAKPFLDALVVENGEGDRCLPDSRCANESNGLEAFYETNYLLDQLVAPETGPRKGR